MRTIKQLSFQALIILNIALLLLITVISTNNVVQAKSRDTGRITVRADYVSRSARTAPVATPVVVTATPAPSPATPKPSTAPVATPVVVTADPVPAPVTPKPTPAPVPVTHTESTVSFASEFQQKVIEYTNAERSAQGLTLLVADAKLASIAHKHSADMLTNNYFSHTSKDGCSAKCRLDSAKYAWQSYGENIYWMSGYDQTASEAARMVVDGWMSSSGHRANILNAKFTNIGIGVAAKGNTIYTTADYTLPK